MHKSEEEVRDIGVQYQGENGQVVDVCRWLTGNVSNGGRFKNIDKSNADDTCNN